MKFNFSGLLRCCTVFLVVLLLLSCVSSPATRKSLDQAYKDRDTTYLARVASGKVRTEDEKTREYASYLFRRFRKEELRKDILDLKARKDADALERMIERSEDPYFEDDLRALAASSVKDLRRSERLAAVEKANTQENLGELKRFASCLDDPYCTPDVRSKAAYYAKALEARIAAKDHERRLAGAGARIARAFDEADSGYLESAAAGKNPGDPEFYDDPGLRKKASVLLAVLKDPGSDIRRLRASKMDPNVSTVPPMITSFISRSPDRYIGPLVEYLTKDAEDPFLKVKRLHDWIADNIRYNFEGYMRGDRGDNSWAGVLASRKAVCAGYAALFDEMCRLAGIRCRIVSGFAKGYGYDPLETVRQESNHAWNAVTIQGCDYLVDATWDSGYINGFNQNVKSYSTEYLFADPERIIYSHFPTDPKMQLLECPKTFEEFRSLPGLRGSFFELGLTTEAELRGVVEAAGSFELGLGCPESIMLSASLRDMNDRWIENACMVVRDGARIRVLASLPEAKPYTLILFGGPWEKKGTTMKGLLEIVLDNKAPAGDGAGFPTFYGDYYENQCQLLEPTDGALKKGRKYEFRIRSPMTGPIVWILEDQIVRFDRSPDGVFSSSLMVLDSGEVEIYIKDPKGGYGGILKYTVQ